MWPVWCYQDYVWNYLLWTLLKEWEEMVQAQGIPMDTGREKYSLESDFLDQLWSNNGNICDSLKRYKVPYKDSLNRMIREGWKSMLLFQSSYISIYFLGSKMCFNTLSLELWSTGGTGHKLHVFVSREQTEIASDKLVILLWIIQR